MLIFTVIAKFTFFNSLLAVYLLLLSFNHLLGKLRLIPAKEIAIVLTKYFAKLVLWNFNIKIKSELLHTTQPALYVANHLSYLDAVAIFSEIEAVFITSTEIRDSLGLGNICKMANCIFVNRQKIWGLKDEIKQISNTLNDGHSVVLFPEGTTTHGHSMTKFKSSLLQSAVESKTPVIPITINYSKFNNREPQLEDRDYYCWYGTMDFMPHIIRLCTMKSLEITLTQTEILLPFDRQSERKIIAQCSRRAIESHLVPVALPIIPKSFLAKKGKRPRIVNANIILSERIPEREFI